MNEQHRLWLAYLRHELPEAERIRIGERIVTDEGYAAALADFEYDSIDAGRLPGLRIHGDPPWRLEILAVAALVFLGVLFTLRPQPRPAPPAAPVPAVFVALGGLRDPAAIQTLRLPGGPRLTFELELPEPPPGGVCTALGQSGPCGGPVFRLPLDRPAPGIHEIELTHSGQLVAIYVFRIE